MWLYVAVVQHASACAFAILQEQPPVREERDFREPPMHRANGLPEHPVMRLHDGHRLHDPDAPHPYPRNVGLQDHPSRRERELPAHWQEHFGMRLPETQWQGLPYSGQTHPGLQPYSNLENFGLNLDDTSDRVLDDNQSYGSAFGYGSRVPPKSQGGSSMPGNRKPGQTDLFAR